MTDKDIIIGILLAAVIGGIIGFEREALLPTGLELKDQM